MKTTTVTAYDSIELGEHEYDLRIEAEVEPGSPEVIPPYSRPDLYDPGSGPEIHSMALIVEFPRFHPQAHEVRLSRRFIERELPEHYLERLRESVAEVEAEPWRFPHARDDDYGDYIRDKRRDDALTGDL